MGAVPRGAMHAGKEQRAGERAAVGAPPVAGGGGNGRAPCPLREVATLGPGSWAPLCAGMRAKLRAEDPEFREPGFQPRKLSTLSSALE